MGLAVYSLQHKYNMQVNTPAFAVTIPNVPVLGTNNWHFVDPFLGGTSWRVEITGGVVTDDAGRELTTTHRLRIFPRTTTNVQTTFQEPLNAVHASRTTALIANHPTAEAPWLYECYLLIALNSVTLDIPGLTYTIVPPAAGAPIQARPGQ